MEGLNCRTIRKKGTYLDGYIRGCGYVDWLIFEFFDTVETNGFWLVQSSNGPFFDYAITQVTDFECGDNSSGVLGFRVHSYNYTRN